MVQPLGDCCLCVLCCCTRVDLCLQARKKYAPFRSYCQSKLANVMAAAELNHRCQLANFDAAGALVTATSVHPGLVDTPLARGYFEGDWLPALIRPMAKPIVRVLEPVFLKRPSLGAAPVLLAALGVADEVAGQYISGQKVATAAKAAADVDQRAQLWQVSCELARIMDPLPLPDI